MLSCWLGVISTENCSEKGLQVADLDFKIRHLEVICLEKESPLTFGSGAGSGGEALAMDCCNC